jgi:YVTN family beta-propeller protein
VLDSLNVRNYPTAIEFNPVKGERYVINRGNDSISIINTDDRTNIRHINNISNNPFDFALDTSLGHLYIINEDLNPIIKVMNVSNKTIIDSRIFLIDLLIVSTIKIIELSILQIKQNLKK